MTERTIIVALDDDIESLNFYELACRSVVPAPLRLELFSSDEAAINFVAREHHRILGYIQNLFRDRERDEGPLEGIEFLNAVIRPITPEARVIIRSAVPELAEETARGDSNTRLLSKYASPERFEQLLKWLIEPFAHPAESSGTIERVPPLIRVVSGPWTELRRHLAAHPDELHRIDPRKFEELVAEVYRDHGWEVELSVRTRDGGYDIIALRKSMPNELKVLIEAKRYDPSRKVGVAVVRALYGIRALNRASQVVLATSSYVSRDAKKEFRHAIPHELGLLERDAILEWCRGAGAVELGGFSK
ncbi:MAG TPA: restriction endonuclease [Longimicrobium sp.]